MKASKKNRIKILLKKNTTLYKMIKMKKTYAINFNNKKPFINKQT